MHLLKGYAHADLGIFEQIFAVDSDNFAAFDAGKLSLFLRQGLRAWKIQFQDVSRLDRCRDGKRDKDARLADVTASAVKEHVSFRYPNTNRPGNTASAALTLLS